MNRHDSLRPITRRALRIDYRSPLICLPAVIESGSGDGITSTIEFTAVTRVAATELRACPTAEGQVVLDWFAIQGAFAYVVYRADAADGVYTVIDSGNQATFFADTPPAAGTYYYRVSGLEPNFGETELSNIASATI